MKIEEIKFDCRYFKGHIPCKPNKEKGEICPTCTSFEEKGHKILIIKLGALGDVIRTTPLLTRFRAEYPQSFITWITLSPEILPSQKIDRIFKYNLESLETLYNEEFDLAINIDKEPETCILLKKIHAKEKRGFIWENGHIAPANQDAEHKLLTGLFDQLSLDNTKNYLQEIFEIAGFEFHGENYLLDVQPDLDQKWKTIIDKQSAGRKVIGLNTGCGPRWTTRLWPIEYWKLLIQDLYKNGYFPMVMGGPSEKERNEELNACTNAWYPGIHSLQDFIAINNQCDVVVSAVSMAMHIAIGLKKNLVLFNNIFNKHEFELYGRGEILEPETGCECFYGNFCKREDHCMNHLNTDTVLKSILKFA